MMAFPKILLLSFFVVYFSNNCYGKIVLPQKLRYLENMLNSDVAKAARLRQRMEGNLNEQEREQGWPSMGLFKAEYKNALNSIPDKFQHKSIYNRRRFPL